MQDSDPKERHQRIRQSDLQQDGALEIEVWLLEAADKPVSPLTKADFTAIHERVRDKLAV